MKKQSIWIAALLFLLAVGIYGCAKTEEGDPGNTGDAGSSTFFNTEAEILQAADPTQESTEEEEENFWAVVDGKTRSSLTGEWIPVEMAKKRPLAIMLNNTAAALPMSGVSNAGVIYECAVEGRITRWMGLFQDWEDLDRIGSVRSCRQYYLHFAQEFDAIYCHFGQAIYALDDLNSGKYDVLSGGTAGIKSPATAMYDRINRPGKASEHTLYAFPSRIPQDIEKKGYRTERKEEFPRKFRFAPDGQVVTYEGYPDATFLQPGGTGGKNGFGGVKATFQYNEGDHLYYRSTYGNPHMDELTGKQVSVKNVIFQYCEGNVLDAKDYLSFATQRVGGKCTVFTEGKMVEGSWSNPGELGTPARYYDTEGNEIMLNTGTTFICIIWEDYANDVVIQ
ncbi:MAG: DUF3048 domain-containing protein [Lachnospiraceae bacterium]|jgi:hypothetical protein|nr:DUF3048 domain-containing protein [Lachnospiraceae bacterium]MCI9133852.1 DUF3048 domain-containing protein [Lachnospiraceae bacterium]